MSPRVSSKLPLLMLGLLVVGVFFPVVRFGFLDWDDTDMVVTNPYLDLSWQSIRHLWTRETLGLYTPLAYTLWGMLPRSAAAFHLLNVILHAGVTCVVYGLLRKKCRSELAALLGAAIFAVHPLHVEPVAWVSGMNNLLAAGFMLAAVLVFPVERLGESSLTAEQRERPHARYALSTLLFAAALFSKPTAVTTPLLLMVWYGLWDRRMWAWVAPWWVMAGLFAVIAAGIQPAADAPRVALLDRPAVVLDAIGFYATKLILPYSLTPDPMRRPDMVGWLHPYVAIGLCVAMAAIRVRAARVFLVPLVPVLGIASFDFQAVSTVADRYAYVSVIALAMFVAECATYGGKWLKVGGGVLVAVCVVLSVQQLGKWSSTQELFSWAMQVKPESYVAPRVLGFAAAKRGDRLEAEKLYRQSLARRDDPLTRLYLANLLRETDPSEALVHYTRAVSAHAPVVKSRALTNRGILHARSGELDQARVDFEDAIQSNPSYAPPYANLALLIERVNPSQARELFRQALERDPTLPAARAGIERLR